MKMTKEERILQEREKMVKAMEYIVRQCNDETAMNGWLMCGVADGDIEYGNFEVDDPDIEYYIEDDNFAELMGCFLRTMKRAQSGGLYCGGVVSE